MNAQTLSMPAILPPLGAIPPAQVTHGPSSDFRFNFGLFSAMRQAIQSRHKTMPITVMSRADFIHHVTMHLPEVSARIEEDDFGIVHLEMAAMKLATRDAILAYEFHTVRRHYSFIAYLYEHADKELHDAIRVSYLEGLFVGEETAEYEHARGLLPKNLAEALKKLDLRYALFEAQPQRLQEMDRRFQLTFP